MSKLIPENIQPAEYLRNVHRVKAAETDTIDDVLAPDYWTHVAQKVRVGDKLEIFPEGGAWYVEALVVSSSNIHLKLVALTKVQINEPVKKAEKNDEKKPFTVEFKGPQRKWSVIRTSDKSYVKEGFEDKDDAIDWLKANEKDLG